MEDLKLEGMIDVDLGFGEIIKVRANGIKYIEIDSDYVFTIHYDNGTTQKVPTIYKDFSEILNQIKAQNSKGDEFMKNSKSVIDSVSNSASAADASAKNAAQSATDAAVYAGVASDSASASKASEKNASDSATKSANSASASAISEKNAAASAASAEKSATDAAGYAGAALYSIGVNPETGHMAIFYNKENS